MSTYRYSGDIRIRITYLEDNTSRRGLNGQLKYPNGKYRCFFRSPDGDADYICIVGAPACIYNAVDSPEAFDAVARAAIAFCIDDNESFRKEGKDFIDYGDFMACCADGNIHIGRNKRNAWPTSKIEAAYNEMNRRELGLGYMQGKKGL